MPFKFDKKPAEQRPSCLWSETSEDEGLWRTDCGCDISEEDRYTVRWCLDGEFCPWCGGRIAEETMEERRATAADDWGDRMRDRMLEEGMFDERDEGVA